MMKLGNEALGPFGPSFKVKVKVNAERTPRAIQEGLLVCQGFVMKKNNLLIRKTKPHVIYLSLEWCRRQTDSIIIIVFTAPSIRLKSSSWLRKIVLSRLRSAAPPPYHQKKKNPYQYRKKNCLKLALILTRRSGSQCSQILLLWHIWLKYEAAFVLQVGFPMKGSINQGPL